MLSYDTTPEGKLGEPEPYITAVVGTTDYLLHVGEGVVYRLTVAEACRVQTAGVPFQSRGGEA